MSPLRYVLPAGARRWYEGHRSTVGYVLLVVYITLVGAWAFNKFDSNDEQIRENGRQAFRQIEASRVQQSREGCQRTNRKILAPLREQVQQGIRDLERVPPGELERFGFTRRELEARNRAQLARVQPVDCARLARRVKRSSPDFSP